VLAILASVAAIFGVPAGAATVTMDSQRDGAVIVIHASAMLDADTATAWRVLTDYERYTEFIPDLHVSRVISRHGDVVTVEQSGDAQLWLLRFPMNITFEIVEHPTETLRSRALAGSLRSLSSTYTLTSQPPGTRLDYAGRVEPGFELLGELERTAVEQSGRRHFQALADEIEHQAATRRLPVTEGAE
jgi:ribosome-associated toxin RatA of RatAB toxin-antitoxin module